MTEGEKRLARILLYREDGPPPRWIDVYVTDREWGRVRVEPAWESDKEAFLDHVKHGGSISVTEQASVEDKAAFVDGFVEEAGSMGGLFGEMARGALTRRRNAEEVRLGIEQRVEEEEKPLDKPAG